MFRKAATLKLRCISVKGRLLLIISTICIHQSTNYVGLNITMDTWRGKKVKHSLKEIGYILTNATKCV